MLRIASTVAALLLVLLAALPSGALAAPARAPKVVLIVGPAGPATDGYRALADQAASAAAEFTPNVVKVYSPNATWPAVRQALDGASIVVYLGHGNGWPSRYRTSLYPPGQNGFGLNPTAGGDDDTHQYFGEARIAADVKLAKDAVVVLSHLCYASGNTEPGLPEGTTDDAIQRVDNYAAGFIDAGAAAVIAEGHLGPAYYVRALLAADRSIERVWRTAPTANGHLQAFDSARSKGFTGIVDPDRAGSGFYRSIVLRSGSRSGALQASAPLIARAVGPANPTLVGTGLGIGTSYFLQRPIATQSTRLWIPYTLAPGLKLPSGLTVGIRWDPIDVPDSVPGAPEDPSAGPVLLVVPERLGSVVEPTAAAIGKTRIKADVTFPSQPGRYRLVITLHDATGVAYDGATQALIGGLLVRVTGDPAAEYLVANQMSVTAGAAFELPVGVANLGTHSWGPEQLPSARRPEASQADTSAILVARWVALAADGIPAAEPSAASSQVVLPAGLAVGGIARVVIAATAPTAAGDYLLVLDTVLPSLGSLAAKGVDPALVRVTVTPPAG